MEITVIIGIIVFSLKLFTRKTKNQKMANQVKYLIFKERRKSGRSRLQRRMGTGERKRSQR